MYKTLLAILLFVATFAVMAHGTLVYQVSTTEAIMAEEEPSDDKPLLKEAKEFSKESVGYFQLLYRQASLRLFSKVVLHNRFHCSKGFYNKPYNPPDFS